jgi:hypothetical protein
MPSSTKDYIVRKATSLQNRANDIRQQQLQQQAITETILSTSRTIRGDVSDLQELEAVLEHMEMLQTMSDSLREQPFQTILELGVELQDILQKIKKLHNAFPLPSSACTLIALILASLLTATTIYNSYDDIYDILYTINNGRM